MGAIKEKMTRRLNLFHASTAAAEGGERELVAFEEFSLVVMLFEIGC